MDKVVSQYKVPFGDIVWQQVRPDVRQKMHCEGSRQIRLVEFETSDGAEQWCHDGHIGYVLKGSLRIDFNGNVSSFAAGDAMIIPPGASHQHRAVWIEAGTQLLMIEDLQPQDSQGSAPR
jgi:quercetin dioxygenase-like cupin family protein